MSAQNTLAPQYSQLLAQTEQLLGNRVRKTCMASSPLGSPSDLTFAGDPQTLEELRAELECPAAPACEIIPKAIDATS